MVCGVRSNARLLIGLAWFKFKARPAVHVFRIGADVIHQDDLSIMISGREILARAMWRSYAHGDQRPPNSIQLV